MKSLKIILTIITFTLLISALPEGTIELDFTGHYFGEEFNTLTPENGGTLVSSSETKKMNKCFEIKGSTSQPRIKIKSTCPYCGHFYEENEENYFQVANTGDPENKIKHYPILPCEADYLILYDSNINDLLNSEIKDEIRKFIESKNAEGFNPRLVDLNPEVIGEGTTKERINVVLSHAFKNSETANYVLILGDETSNTGIPFHLFQEYNEIKDERDWTYATNSKTQFFGRIPGNKKQIKEHLKRLTAYEPPTETKTALAYPRCLKYINEFGYGELEYPEGANPLFTNPLPATDDLDAFNNEEEYKKRLLVTLLCPKLFQGIEIKKMLSEHAEVTEYLSPNLCDYTEQNTCTKLNCPTCDERLNQIEDMNQKGLNSLYIVSHGADPNKNNVGRLSNFDYDHVILESILGKNKKIALFELKEEQENHFNFIATRACFSANTHRKSFANQMIQGGTNFFIGSINEGSELFGPSTTSKYLDLNEEECTELNEHLNNQIYEKDAFTGNTWSSSTGRELAQSESGLCIVWESGDHDRLPLIFEKNKSLGVNFNEMILTRRKVPVTGIEANTVLYGDPSACLTHNCNKEALPEMN